MVFIRILMMGISKEKVLEREFHVMLSDVIGS